MYSLERLGLTVLHKSCLQHVAWLRELMRPFYEASLLILYPRGLKRVINGTDQILIPHYKRNNVSESYEPEAWKYLMDNLQRGDVVADVGAAMGLYTIALAKRVGPRGKVFAFEPLPILFEVLKQMVRMNKVSGRVELIQKKVFDRHHFKFVSLDAVFENKRLDILKIDVEGAEERVLLGGVNLLADKKRAPRLILIEVHPHYWPIFGATGAAILAILEKCGYVIVDTNNQIIREINSWGWIIAKPSHDKG